MIALGVKRALALVPAMVAMPAGRNDVRTPVAAAFAARREVFRSTAQLCWTTLAVEPHPQATVEAPAALAVERELSGLMKLF